MHYKVLLTILLQEKQQIYTHGINEQNTLRQQLQVGKLIVFLQIWSLVPFYNLQCGTL